MTSRWITVPVALLLVVVCAVGVLVGTAAVAAAHNSLAGSDPAEGATPAEAPPSIVLRFASPAPLDTASVEVIDVTGSRTEVAGLAHGPGGESEIVAPLPALPAGPVTVRWRLVGPDGHPVTGRVGFVVGDPSAGVVDIPNSTPAGGPVPGPGEDSAAAVSAGGSLRWSLRVLSYGAVTLLIGLVAAGSLLHEPGGVERRVRAALLACGAAGVLAAVQLLVLAGDIEGRSPITAWSGLGSALGTTAGAALLFRVVLAVLLAGVLAGRLVRPEQMGPVTAALCVLLLLTWSFAGHARSMRWPVLGVPVDVAHHGAAAVWLGGLLVMSRLGMTGRSPDALAWSLQRFSRLAQVAVGTLVVTGVVQAVRLTGLPDLSLGTAHTNLLVGKVVLLGAMLAVADVNRKRVARRFSDPRDATPGIVWAVRRAMGVELCLGAVVVALTAALVVSPPPVG